MPKGRPRNFDADEAIDKAMKVFWRKGFEGTTIPDLTAALGINRPSLYAAFGNKESLFRLVLDRYRRDPASYVNRALVQPTAREVFRELLSGVIDLVTDPDNPGGCLFVCGSLASSEEGEPIRNELSSRRLEGEAEIRERFDRARKEGDLPADTDSQSLAKFAATMIWGLSIQGMNGSSKKEMMSVANIAIESFEAKIRNKKPPAANRRR